MPIRLEETKHETRIEFVQHPTAKSVALGYFRGDHPRMSDDRLMQQRTDFQLLIGKVWVKRVRVCELVKWIHVNGVWGYCHHKSKYNKEIHFWIGKRARREKVMELLLHEIMHAGGFFSEKLVCKLAVLGVFAYQIFESDFDKTIAWKRKKVPHKLAAWHAWKES